MRSETEIQRQLIAILTAVLNADTDAEELPEEVAAANIEGIFDFDIDLTIAVRRGGPPDAEVEALVNQAVQQMVEQLQPQLSTLVSFMGNLLRDLAWKAKVTCPDLDVADFLRNRAVELTAED